MILRYENMLVCDDTLLSKSRFVLTAKHIEADVFRKFQVKFGISGFLCQKNSFKEFIALRRRGFFGKVYSRNVAALWFGKLAPG